MRRARKRGSDEDQRGPQGPKADQERTRKTRRTSRTSQSGTRTLWVLNKFVFDPMMLSWSFFFMLIAKCPPPRSPTMTSRVPPGSFHDPRACTLGPPPACGLLQNFLAGPRDTRNAPRWTSHRYGEAILHTCWGLPLYNHRHSEHESWYAVASNDDLPNGRLPERTLERTNYQWSPVAR